MWTFDATPLSFCSQAMCNNDDVSEYQVSHLSDYEDVEDSNDNDDDNDAYDLTAPVTMVCLCSVLPTVH